MLKLECEWDSRYRLLSSWEPVKLSKLPPKVLWWDKREMDITSPKGSSRKKWLVGHKQIQTEKMTLKLGSSLIWLHIPHPGHIEVKVRTPRPCGTHPQGFVGLSPGSGPHKLESHTDSCHLVDLLCLDVKKDFVPMALLSISLTDAFCTTCPCGKSLPGPQIVCSVSWSLGRGIHVPIAVLTFGMLPRLNACAFCSYRASCIGYTSVTGIVQEHCVGMHWVHSRVLKAWFLKTLTIPDLWA